MPRAMDAIWRVGTECLNAPALCLSVAVCACRCLCRLCLHLSVSCRPMYTSAYDRPFVSVAALVCLCLPLSFAVCHSVRRQLHAPSSLPFSCLPAPSLARRHTATLPCLLFTCTSLCVCVRVRVRVRACVCAERACLRKCASACVRACVRALRALRCVWPVGAGRGYATNIFQHLAACTALKPHTRMSMHPLVKFRQRIGRPEESWCPWQTEGRPACFCGSRCRSFAAGTCVHASQPQKAPPQDRRIARVRGSEFRTGRKGADACPRTLCMGGNLRSISASSTSGGVPSCGVRGISFVRHDHSGAGPTMIAGCS